MFLLTLINFPLLMGLRPNGRLGNVTSQLEDHISQSGDQYWLCHLSRLARLNEFPASNLSPELIKFWALRRHQRQHKAFRFGLQLRETLTY